MYSRFIFSLFIFASSVTIAAEQLMRPTCEKVLTAISPPHANRATKNVLKNFVELSRLLRNSGNEAAARELIISKAKIKSLPFGVDSAGNLFVSIPATPGYDGKATIALQSHLDMVLDAKEISPGQTIETIFAQGIPALESKAGWLQSKSQSTSSGFDNGIGVAMMMRFITNPPSEHPSLKLIFTVQEEVGLKGAAEVILPPDVRAVVNLDSEVFGTVATGCLGSCRVEASAFLETVAVPDNVASFRVSLTGLKGGHSGLDIHLRRANAVQLFAELLKSLFGEFDVLLSEAAVGDVNIFNKIPDKFAFNVAISADRELQLRRSISLFFERLKTKYSEDKFDIKINKAVPSETAMSPTTITHVVNAILQLPNGILVPRTGPGFTNNMDLSNNLSWFELPSNGQARLGMMSRAFVQQSLENFVKQQKMSFAKSGLNLKVVTKSPAWTPSQNSIAIDTLFQIVQEQGYGKFHIESAAGGIELAHFAMKHPGVDMISIGPTIVDLHNHKERVDLSTIEKIIDITDRLLVRLGFSYFGGQIAPCISAACKSYV